MVPWLRILPIGGVSAAVLILVLAQTPPRDLRQGVSPDLALARGALLDRNEHPEWPQFLMQAAYRRAGEILKLRDLPNAPMVSAPVALPPERPITASEPPPSAPPPDSAVQSAAKALEAAKSPNETAVTPAPQPAPMQTATLSADVDDVKAAATLAPALPTGDAVTAAPEAADVLIATPLPTPAPAETRVAVLPQERPSAEIEVTGTINATADVTTIPVDIGESSSDELPVVLPPERPPILRIIERARSSHLKPRKRAPRRVRAVAKPKAATARPASEANLFEALFDPGQNQREAVAQKRGAAQSAGNPPNPPFQTYPGGSR
jgi:hypothetical protein